MKARIFRNIIGISVVVILILTFLLSIIFYYSISKEFKKQLKEETHLSSALLKENSDNIEIIKDTLKDTRITIIDKEGNVLFESRADLNQLDNHANRVEVIEAFFDGDGEVTRYSSTLGEETFYYAIVFNEDSVIRGSKTTKSFAGVLVGLIPPLIAVLILVVIVGSILASKLAAKIVKPISKITEDKPLVYEELRPYSDIITSQHKEINRGKEELQEKSDLIHLVLSQMSEGIILLNKKNQVKLINQSAIKVFNAPNNVLDKNILQTTRDQSILQCINKAKKDGTSETKYKAGENIYKLFYSATDSGGVIIVIVDITEAEKAEIIRSEFSANVSHELKTPLASISGYAEMLSSGIAKPEDTEKFIEKIRQETKRMTVLIDEILILSNLEKGHPKAREETVVLEDVCNSIFESLSLKAKQNNISLSQSGNATIKAKEIFIYETLFNLIDNAIQYNKPNGKVDVNFSKKDNKIIIEISDTGIGIPDEHINRLFERFYRVDKSRSKQTGGTGLGLSIVKHMVYLYDGKIDVKSKIGEGTTIVVSLYDK